MYKTILPLNLERVRQGDELQGVRIGGDYAEPESIGFSTHSAPFFLPCENLGSVLPDSPVIQGSQKPSF